MTEQFDMFGDESAWLNKLRTNWSKAIEGGGAICPCCDRNGKVYRARLHQTMALALRWIAVNKEDDDGWVNVQNKGPRWMLKGKNYCLLEHWGLIESKSNRSGVWRATPKALEFIDGTITMPSAVYIYDNRVWGFDDEETSFRSCFGKYFDFDEMMSAQFKWANIKKGEGNV